MPLRCSVCATAPAEGIFIQYNLCLQARFTFSFLPASCPAHAAPEFFDLIVLGLGSVGSNQENGEAADRLTDAVQEDHLVEQSSNQGYTFQTVKHACAALIAYIFATIEGCSSRSILLVVLRLAGT